MTSGSRCYWDEHISVASANITSCTCIQYNIVVRKVVQEQQILSNSAIFKCWNLQMSNSIRIGKVREWWNKLGCTALNTFQSDFISFSDGGPDRTCIFQVGSYQELEQKFKQKIEQKSNQKLEQKFNHKFKQKSNPRSSTLAATLILDTSIHDPSNDAHPRHLVHRSSQQCSS